MPKKILIVDDELDLLALVSIRLRTSGYEVLLASDGVKAIELLSEYTPDLILLDLLMPNMDGNECCKKIKASSKFKHIPVVLFTAVTNCIDDKAKAAGADDYILKPFEPSELLHKIKRFIG
jgi:DNA-binding response OmpR family regulator